MQSSVGISKQEPAHLACRQLHGPCLHQKGGCSAEELACLEEGAELGAALKKICRSDPEPGLVIDMNHFWRALLALGWQMEEGGQTLVVPTCWLGAAHKKVQP